MSSSDLPPRTSDHPAAPRITSMPFSSSPISDAELSLLTPPPPTHNRQQPFPLPTPGWVDNQMDQEQPPDSFFGIAAWQAFPGVYTVKRHSAVHVSATPKEYLRRVLPFMPSTLDLLIGHFLESLPSVAVGGLAGAAAGRLLLKRSALLSGALTAAVAFPADRLVRWQLYCTTRLESDARAGAPAPVPLSARRSWRAMDAEGNVRKTAGAEEWNPYQRWEEGGWVGRKREVWETIYRKIDEEKLKEALQRREQREKATKQKNAAAAEEH